jgi:hypothetical protein
MAPLRFFDAYTRFENLAYEFETYQAANLNDSH